tara:strand:- start:460 stop:993 length:534 start_codon:yes stop_codon:yes gene_type:complete
MRCTIYKTMQFLNLPMARKIKKNASLIKRGVAFVIDIAIINLIISYPLKSYINQLIPTFTSFTETYNYFLANQELSYSLMSISIAISVLSIAYFTILESNLGQSIGKKFLHLKVISLEKNPKIWQHIIRNIFLIPLFPFLLLWIIDPIYIFFNTDGQRLTESISKTKVIEEFSQGYF